MLKWDIFFTNGTISSNFCFGKKNEKSLKKSLSSKTTSQLSPFPHFSGWLPKQKPHYLHNLSARSFATTKMLRIKKVLGTLMIYVSGVSGKTWQVCPYLFTRRVSAAARHARVRCSSLHRNTGKGVVKCKGLRSYQYGIKKAKYRQHFSEVLRAYYKSRVVLLRCWGYN